VGRSQVMLYKKSGVASLLTGIVRIHVARKDQTVP